MNILVVYATTEGQTRKIATFIKMETERLGHHVTLLDITDQDLAPVGFDIVFIGASMHMEKYQTSIKQYIQRFYKELNETHTAFFSVSLTAASDETESWKELQQITTRFIAGSKWKPFKIEYLAGALRFTQYDFMKKFIMRQIAKKAGHTANGDAEYTDWEKVKTFVAEVINGYGLKPINVGPELTDEEIIG